jgi:hypothetical protein
MQMITSGMMEWLWNVAGMREKTNSNRVLVGKPERKGPFGEQYVND